MGWPTRAFARVAIAAVVLVVGGGTLATAALTGSIAWAVAVLAGGILGGLTTLLAVGASAASNGDLVPALREQIDPVTRVPREEKLHQDIRGVMTEAPQGPVTLYRFAIEGFKAYNDAFGDACGDALLGWLARKLRSAVGTRGVVYRSRGAGFAVLTPASKEATADLREQCVAALQETGEGFSVSCVVGAVALGNEVTEPQEALELAARRAQGERGPHQAKSGLRPAAERAEGGRLGRSGVDADALAASLARTLGIQEEQLKDVKAAVRLRDLGNLAVPGAVFASSGELPGQEWEFILLHTLVGERLLSVSFGMEGVAKLVRSSHERFDGSGYPDGLIGAQIPLGSRILFVCSAFQDMIAERAHRPALEMSEALAELERGAGTQFDPDVVRAFRQEIAGSLEHPVPEASAPVKTSPQ